MMTSRTSDDLQYHLMIAMSWIVVFHETKREGAGQDTGPSFDGPGKETIARIIILPHQIFQSNPFIEKMMPTE